MFRIALNVPINKNKNKYFNRNQKLYIIANKITTEAIQDCEYLSDKFKLNINHIEYQVLKSDINEYFLSLKRLYTHDELKADQMNQKIQYLIIVLMTEKNMGILYIER